MAGAAGREEAYLCRPVPACLPAALPSLSCQHTPHTSLPLTACPYLCRPTTAGRCRAAAAAWAVRATGGQPPSHLVTTQQKLYSPKCPFAQLPPRPNTGRGQEPRHTTSPRALARPSEPLKAKTEGCVKAQHNTGSAGPRHGGNTAEKHYGQCCEGLPACLTLYLAVWAIAAPEARHQALFLSRLLMHDVKILRDATIIAIS